MKRNTICMTVFVMQHCNRLSAQRRSPGATLWWWPRRWPRSKHQLVGFPICICICLCTWRFSKFSRFVTIQSSKPYFSLGPVFSEWGRENLVREVFQDTELEIFPWQGTLESEPRVLWATSTWLVLDLCVGSKRRHRWGRRHKLLRHNCGLAVALAKCPQLQQWTKKLPCDFKLIGFGFKSKVKVRLKSDPDCLI